MITVMTSYECNNDDNSDYDRRATAAGFLEAEERARRALVGVEDGAYNNITWYNMVWLV